jgi:hypothetical protein
VKAAAPVPFGWARAAGVGLTFRPITDADLPFLARVYAATRAEELAATSMIDAHKAAFLLLQFQAQHAHYQKYYPKADWLVTMRDGQDTGRLYIERWPSQHRIIDIAFLPEHRGKGAGEARPDGRGGGGGQGRLDPCREIQPGDAAVPPARLRHRGRQGRLRPDALETIIPHRHSAMGSTDPE